MILPVFSRQNWCYDEFVLEFILSPILARKTGKITFLKSNTGVYTLYESHTKRIHYMAEEARVLARITSKIKEFIQYYGFESDPPEMRK